MQSNDKIKITKKDFDDIYELENIEEKINEEIKEDIVTQVEKDVDESFLTFEEQEHEKWLEDNTQWGTEDAS